MAHRIGVIPGDGIGPQVVDAALAVVRAAGVELEERRFDIGADRYARDGHVLDDADIEGIRACDAILKGPLGPPIGDTVVPPGTVERGIILRLRFELDQYVNLRPIKLYPGVPCPLRDKGPEDIDMVVVRENTEGIYAGVGGFFKKGTPDEVATQTSVNTRKGVERVVRYAFETARRRPRRKLTLCGKTNVLTYAHDLWHRVFHEVGEEYPDVERDYAHVDAICFWFVNNPEWFDVIVTDNQLGDIITDLGAALQGGMGVAASGNLNPEGVSMFEPVGGTAPQFTGQNVINPMAAIGAVRMLLDHLGESDAASRVDAAMASVFPRLEGMGAGEMGYSTSEVGDMVATAVADGDAGENRGG